MNPGLEEEAGSTVRSTVTALASSNSTCLAAVLLAALFSALIYFSVQRERENSHAHAMAVMERCFPAALMKAYQTLEIGTPPPVQREDGP